MKFYKEYRINAEPFLAEVIEGMMWELPIEGVFEDVNCIVVYANENNDEVNTETISAILEKLKEQKMLFNYLVEENIVENKNWNEEWEKNVRIIEVTDRIVIKPSFKNYDSKPGQVIIQIDPKMSFGTGEHQSTRLMLQMMEEVISDGQSILDVGSGTGVLSIAAIKLGASKAVALDIDEWCLENGKENVKANNVDDKIEVVQGDIYSLPEKVQYEVVLANIQKNILMEIAGELSKKTKDGGYLLLSGLLYIDEKDIVSKYTSNGFSVVKLVTMDEWIGLLLKK